MFKYDFDIKQSIVLNKSIYLYTTYLRVFNGKKSRWKLRFVRFPAIVDIPSKRYRLLAGLVNAEHYI